MDIQHNTLQYIIAEHQGKVSDKWSIYISEYDRLFDHYRDRPLRLLEIGIQNGGSLEIWSKFFYAAEKLVGCDINPACEQLTFDDPRIVVVVADANTDEAQNRILAISDSFDLIVDDGSHQSGDIARSFMRYFNCLNDGGLYVAEDLHCSYWQDFEGGIFQPYSSIAFFKLLTDTINHEHWGIDKTRVELLRQFNLQYAIKLDEVALAHIHSIEFINSMCVIRKASPNENLLGKRIVAGNLALVDTAPIPLHWTLTHHPNQSQNPWASRDMPLDLELTLRVQQIADLNKDHHALENQLENLQHVTQGQITEFLQQLQELQQAHEQQKIEQSRDYNTREQSYIEQLAQTQQKSETYLLQLTEQELDNAKQLQTMQKEGHHEHIKLVNQHNENILAYENIIKHLQISLAQIHSSFIFKVALFVKRIFSIAKHEINIPIDMPPRHQQSSLSLEVDDINTKVLQTMASKNIEAVNSIEELLALFDQDFINCVYLTLLHRLPDAVGASYYLSRIRSGVHKLEIIKQVRLSNESKVKQVNVQGLDQAVKNYIKQKKSIRSMLKHMLGLDQQYLRAIENKLYLLDNHLTLQFYQLNYSIAQLSQSIKSEANSAKKDDSISILSKTDSRDDAHGDFDAEWYLQQYPDVIQAGMEPLSHYISHGREEGRYPFFDEEWYFRRYPDVAAAGLNPLKHYLEHGKAEGRFPAYSDKNADGNNYFKWINDYDTVTDKYLILLKERLNNLLKTPIISVVMPVYNPNPTWLIEAIHSVQQQAYPNWELCIADDKSSNPQIRPILERFAAEDKRIKVSFREENGHISAASNSALALATGKWIALLDHDDLLPLHALFWVVDAINKNPNARLFYSDEDKITELGQRYSPYFKCDWNQDLFYGHNMFSHLGVYDAELVQEVNGFRVGMEGSQDYDLALRCIERIDTNQIHHISRVLYHWRVHAESTASNADAKPYAMIAGEKAINEHFKRMGINANVELTSFGYRTRYYLPAEVPLVSLIIPTRNGFSLLKQCVNSIMQKTDYKNYEIIIVDNGSDEEETLQYLNHLVNNKIVTVIRDDAPFNYSALNNKAVKIANGDIIGLVNNDIEVISPEWLSEMVSHALRPDVGVVGAKLLYSNNTIQHAGVVLGVTGIAGHAHRGVSNDAHGYFSRASLTQSFSAVTGACLIVEKSIYDSVSGLNEADLAVAFNDIDFCLRVRELGYKNIWTPYAELYHHESATRGSEDTPEKKKRFECEIAYMQQCWASEIACDESYSKNLTLDEENFSLAWPPRVEILN